MVQLITTALKVPKGQDLYSPKSLSTSPFVTVVTSTILQYLPSPLGRNGTRLAFPPILSAQWHFWYKVLNTCNASSSSVFTKGHLGSLWVSTVCPFPIIHKIKALAESAEREREIFSYFKCLLCSRHQVFPFDNAVPSIIKILYLTTYLSYHTDHITKHLSIYYLGAYELGTYII